MFDLSKYAWNEGTDLPQLIEDYQNTPQVWLMNPQFKYIEIRVDCRNGRFLLYDRDKNKIDPNLLRATVDAAKKKYGVNVRD